MAIGVNQASSHGTKERFAPVSSPQRGSVRIVLSGESDRLSSRPYFGGSAGGSALPLRCLQKGQFAISVSLVLRN